MRSTSLSTKLITVLLLLAVIAYFGVQGYRYLVDPETTTLVYRYHSEESIALRGYVVREEQVVDCAETLIELTHAEGTRVGLGDTVATVYRSAEALQATQELESLRAQKEQLEYARSASSDAETALRLDTDIRDQIIAVRAAYESGSYSALDSLADELKTTVLRREYAYNGSEDLTARLDELNAQISALSGAASGGTTRITAPVSGTVTAVYASVGSSGSGLLFVIEDTDHLVISTSVKGYDLGDVKTGMTVEIKSDATGDSVIPGTLMTIAPTAKKNQLGDTEASNDPSFEAEVSVDSAESGLRIGMEARLSYIIARQAHVLAVPYEAVFTDEAGQSCILVLRTQEKETYLVEKLPVTTGLDDDLDIAVSGTGVEEGLRVITDAKSYLSYIGKTVTLAQATGLEDMMAQMEAYQ